MRYTRSEYEDSLVVADDVGEAEEEMAASALDHPRLHQWIQRMREEYITSGFFERWYGMDGRRSRVAQRKSKGEYLFAEERSAFLLWLRLGTDDAADNLWHETESMLRQLNMDFPGYLTRIMFPLFSRWDVAVIFELVGRDPWDVGFPDLFPFLAPPPWFELLNYAIFNRAFCHLPVYRLDFTNDLKLSGITFLSPDLSEGARIWIIKRVAEGYERLTAGQKRAGEQLEWSVLNNLATPMGIRQIAREFGIAHSTVNSAIKTVGHRLLDDEGMAQYISAAPTVGGLSWLEVVQIAERAYSPRDIPVANNYPEESIRIANIIMLLKNMVDVKHDIESTQNFSKLGICPISGNPLAIFVHQK